MTTVMVTVVTKLFIRPADLEFLERVRGDTHRPALAVQLVWTRTERALVTDLSSLPRR